jgi:hypothetical protein
MVIEEDEGFQEEVVVLTIYQEDVGIYRLARRSTETLFYGVTFC